MKKLKLLFVYPNAVLQNPPPISIALFYALLKGIPGLEIRLFDTTIYDIEAKSSDKVKEEHLQVRPFDFGSVDIALKQGNVYEDFVKIVNEFRPDLLALSCNEVTYSLGLSLLQRIEGYPGLKLVGGVLATFAPLEILRHKCVDMVCLGEGEGAVVDIVRSLQRGEDLEKIANLYIKKNGQIVKNGMRPLVNMDELPLPDYDIFDKARYYRPMAGKVWRLFPIETSRGCPYRCSYCNSPAQSQLSRDAGHGAFFRKKSVPYIGRELRMLVERYKAEYIYFLSDTLLSVTDSEFDEFIRMYSEFKLPFWCQNRPEMVTYERMKKLKEVGCHRMSIGVEHGNEEFRKKILKKSVKNSTVIEAFDILDRVGIPVSINNIIGFPGETRDLAMETIMFNRKLKFDTSNAYAFTPFRGTELYDVCVKNGYIAPNSVSECMTKGSVLKMPKFPKAEIDGLIKTFALYAKMPDEYLPQIARAERDDTEGQRIFKELSGIYTKMFFELHAEDEL